MTWRIETTPLRGNASLRGVAPRDIRVDDRLHSSFLAEGAARDNLDLLLSGDALCVTTGQQPGLLSGPVMTIHKALAAAALAERCSEMLGRKVVPVFWVAGDDHDFAESNHLHLISPTNSVERIELRSRPEDAAAIPLFRETLGEDIKDVFDRVRSCTPDTEFRDAQLDQLSRDYSPDNNLATAFSQSVAKLLGEFGVVVFQPYTSGAKAAFAAVVKSALSNATSINAALIKRSHELERAGRPVPVSVREDHTLVMFEGSLGRDRLLLNGDGFHLRRSGESFSKEELLGLLETNHERFSANVLLRPVTEAAVLPTVAYVAGPTEGQYWEQSDAVFQELGIPRHAVVTRWSGRVVENRVEKTLEKYGLTMEDLSLSDGQLESRLARQAVPDEVESALRTIRHAIDEHMPDLTRAAVAIDVTLQRPLEHAGRNMVSQLDHMERKIVSQLKNRNEILVRQVGAARTAMFPLRKPQERVINVVHYLVRHGPPYLQALMGACQEWAAGLESPVNAT